LRAEARPDFCSVEALGLLSPESLPTAPPPSGLWFLASLKSRCLCRVSCRGFRLFLGAPPCVRSSFLLVQVSPPGAGYSSVSPPATETPLLLALRAPGFSVLGFEFPYRAAVCIRSPCARVSSSQSVPPHPSFSFRRFQFLPSRAASRRFFTSRTTLRHHQVSFLLSQVFPRSTVVLCSRRRPELFVRVSSFSALGCCGSSSCAGQIL
jgi:hypothetical protein